MTAVIKVLYVDDEENNLNSFKANFRRLYEIYTAISAKAAIDILSQTKVHVVISDQRMPDVTGVELFKKLRTLYPEPIRILLTGYTDFSALADAVNEGDIYRYITKPWNELELNNSIQNGYDSFCTKQALAEKVAELQKTNDDLNRFIYSISHELRAPLASVLGSIQLAKLDKVYHPDEKGFDIWKIIEECSNRLDYNINNTLQYYKNGRNISNLEPVDFKTVITELIELHKRANKIKDEVNFNINIEQNEFFIGDKFRIEIILGNLISNAIRYQKPNEPKKEIQIDVKVNLIEAIVSITDIGVGIPDENIGRIFSQFYKAENQKGTGLGLFIVKEAIDRIKGIISVTSKQGLGTTFSIRLINERKKI